MYHGAQGGAMFIRSGVAPDISIFVFHNEHANQGWQCSSVMMYTLVMQNIALCLLGGAQDDFACSLSKLFLMVYKY